jgi:ketosteroid isomerase-like protein
MNPMQQTQSLRAEVEAAQIKWLEAARTSDGEAYIQLLADNFFCVTVDGYFVKKEAFILGLTKRLGQVSRLEMADLEYQIYSNVVVVTGVVNFAAEITGISFNGPQRFTSTWLRESEATPMRCACFHVSDLRKRDAWEKMLAKQ